MKKTFIHDLHDINWQTVENVTDQNLAWKVWEINFNKVLDRHAPLRHQRIRQSSIPWLNSNIKKMMRDRDYHKKQFVKHNSEYHWRIYQIFRNKFNIEIRKSKSVITVKKLANAIKTIQKIPGNQLILSLVIPVCLNTLMKLKLTIKPFVMIKIYPKLLTNSLLILALN